MHSTVSRPGHCFRAVEAEFSTASPNYGLESPKALHVHGDPPVRSSIHHHIENPTSVACGLRNRHLPRHVDGGRSLIGRIQCVLRTTRLEHYHILEL